ncbi:MAG: FlgD immunoglobulin-like domain containing protein [bacterium]
MFNDTILPGLDGNRDEGVQTENGEPDHEAKRPQLRLEISPRKFYRLSKQAAKRTFTRFCFHLPERAVISVAVHNSSGRRVCLPVATVLESGCHRVQWDGRDDRGQFLPPGIYVVKVEAAGEQGNLYRASARVTVAP